MSLHHTPRNGDYAAHIDQLVNQGARAPGQTTVTPPSRPATRRWRKKVSVEKTFTASNSDEAPAATLANASKRRTLGLFRYLIAIFLLIHAVRILLDAFTYGTDVDDFVPAVFLAGIAFIFLRSARATRRKQTPRF